MTHRSFIRSSAFEPEAISAMTEAFEVAVKELPENAQPEVGRELIARRIIAEAKLGERNPLACWKPRYGAIEFMGNESRSCVMPREKIAGWPRGVC